MDRRSPVRLRWWTTLQLAGLAAAVAIAPLAPAAVVTGDVPAPSPQAATATAVDAQAKGSWTPFSATGEDSGFGWARCADPITLSFSSPFGDFDARTRMAIRALAWAAYRWQTETGIPIEGIGTVPATYDRTNGILRPVDGVERTRHIYYAAVPEKAVAMLKGNTVGLAAPTLVNRSAGEYLQGSVLFDANYLSKATYREMLNLFTHELGHALGLGHSGDPRDVMYPILSNVKRLGPGDITGIKQITRPCAPQLGPDPNSTGDGSGAAVRVPVSHLTTYPERVRRQSSGTGS